MCSDLNDVIYCYYVCLPYIIYLNTLGVKFIHFLCRYSFAGASPRYTVGSASPRNGLGNNSPRYAAATYELNVPRRRKHKVKHKKKHKEDRDKKHKDSEVTSTQDDTAKEHCITQKLSINLKRLNNTYTSCRTTTTAAATEETHSSSDEHSEQVPDFPSPNPPLMLRVNAQTVTSAPGADGKFEKSDFLRSDINCNVKHYFHIS